MFGTARRMESVFYPFKEKLHIERTHTRLKGVSVEKLLMFRHRAPHYKWKLPGTEPAWVHYELPRR